jgi:subtilisin family serine protease
MTLTVRLANVWALSALALIGSLSASAAYVDPELQAPPGSSVVVIVQVKDAEPVPHVTDSVRTYAQVRAALVRNSSLSQQNLMGILGRSNTDARRPIRVVQLWIANAMIVELPSELLPQLTNHPDVTAIYADKKIHKTPGLNPHRIDRPGAEPFTYGLNALEIPKVRQLNPKLIGTGVKVGILDTGVDATHPDLRGKLVLFKDFVNQKTAPYDDDSHGTHVTGTIAGGAASGTAIGVAPGAEIIMGKILDSSGSGQDSTILQAMQWIADPDGNPATADQPNIVSNSWGGEGSFTSQDPAQNVYCQAIDNWIKLGIFPVFANGNEGPEPKSVGIPAGCPSALTVGAVNASDVIAPFSSVGPAVWKTQTLIKPEVSAPGVDILSAKPGGTYQTMSGTSMATPHVAGLLALIYQANPGITVEQASQLLIRGVKDLGPRGQDNNYGWGRVDAFDSLRIH